MEGPSPRGATAVLPVRSAEVREHVRSCFLGVRQSSGRRRRAPLVTGSMPCGARRGPLVRISESETFVSEIIVFSFVITAQFTDVL